MWQNLWYHSNLFLQKLLTSHSKSLHNDRFAYDYELRPISNVHPKALLLGVDRFGRTLSIEETEATPYLGHLAVFGPTGSGKTVREVEQIKAWDGPIIINDIKFDLSEKTAEARAKKGPVYFLQPADGVGNQ